MTNKFVYLAAMQLCIFHPAYADQPLNCGTKLIDVGMSMDEVSKYCGKPDSVAVDNQNVHSGDRVTGRTKIVTWHYLQRGGQIDAILVFDVDMLRSIAYVDKAVEGR
jgi:hypothetical protein